MMHQTGERNAPNYFSVPKLFMTFRKSILAGVGVCVLTVAYSLHRYPGIIASPAAPKFLPLFLAGVLWYSLAAIRWTAPATRDDFVVLHYATRWGIAIGLAWAVEVIGGDIIPSTFAGWIPGNTFVAAILPIVAGGQRCGNHRRRAVQHRCPDWILERRCERPDRRSAALASVGYLAANFPDFLHDQEVPPDIGRAYTAAELATYNIEDYLAGGISHLFLIGALFCSAAGALGGLFGRMLRGARADRLSY